MKKYLGLVAIIGLCSVVACAQAQNSGPASAPASGGPVLTASNLRYPHAVVMTDINQIAVIWYLITNRYPNTPLPEATFYCVGSPDCSEAYVLYGPRNGLSAIYLDKVNYPKRTGTVSTMCPFGLTVCN